MSAHPSTNTEEQLRSGQWPTIGLRAVSGSLRNPVQTAAHKTAFRLFHSEGVSSSEAGQHLDADEAFELCPVASLPRKFKTKTKCKRAIQRGGRVAGTEEPLPHSLSPWAGPGNPGHKPRSCILSH